MLQQGRVDVFALSGLGTQDLLNKTNDPNLELVMPVTGIANRLCWCSIQYG